MEIQDLAQFVVALFKSARIPGCIQPNLKVRDQSFGNVILKLEIAIKLNG
jgi:hypothetical protein